MMRWRRAAVVLACAAPAVAFAADLAPDVRTVLTRDLLFSRADLADIDQGKVVKHGLSASAPGEIAVVGGTRVNAPKALFLDRVRDIKAFKRGPDVVQIGTFSTPPVLEDLSALTIDTGDLDVRTCRVYDCDVRLPADTIRRFQAIDPKAVDAQARGAALFKQVLLDHVVAYTSGGSGLITQYDDGKRPIRPMDDFAGLLARARGIGTLVPGLPAHLQPFPPAALAGAQDFLYWSKEKFGIAPFITVTQVTIVCPSAATCVVVSKDVYSSRYIDASLSLTIASDAPQAADAFYLVYANYSRANALKGAFGGLRRAIAERRSRNALEASLKATRLMLESAR
jgi:hypothetical protein